MHVRRFSLWLLLVVPLTLATLSAAALALSNPGPSGQSSENLAWNATLATTGLALETVGLATERVVSPLQSVPPPLTELPTSFDWRDNNGNWMTPVKNQGSWGVCTAFAAAGVVEAMYNIHRDDSAYDLDLSEQNLESLYSCTCKRSSCFSAEQGALLELEYIGICGIVDEGCIPYDSSKEILTCPNSCTDGTDWQGHLYRIGGWGPVDPAYIKAYLVSNGPVLADNMQVQGSGDGFDPQGVYRCRIDNGGNHAVVIAGYNDAGGYWIVKNSWGANWNGDGYFKVGYGECGIENNAFYASFEPVRGSISGTVSDAGGNPIEGCAVSVSSWDVGGDERCGSTNVDGSYAILGLTAGDYRVSVKCEGYFLDYYDGARSEDGAELVTVIGGQDTPNINFIPDLGGSISGTIRDAGGNPLVSCRVDALALSDSGTSGYAYTDQNGAFRVRGLATAYYEVRVNCSGYVRESYNNARDPADAAEVAVNEGQDTPNIDFNLDVGGSISGVITHLDGTPEDSCRVYAILKEGFEYIGSGYTDTNGHYAIRGLVTGVYDVHVLGGGHDVYYDTAVSVIEGQDTPGIDFFLDTDGDEVPDPVDNCPYVSNPNQTNTDAAPIDNGPVVLGDDVTVPNGDGLGNACDTDDDNDWMPDTGTYTLGYFMGEDVVCTGSSLTNPLKADSDGDTVVDGAECLLGSNPNDANSWPSCSGFTDHDHDCLPNYVEAILGSSDSVRDTDGDGLADGLEFKGWGTSPTVRDTDGDGCDDDKEAADVNGDAKANGQDRIVVLLRAYKYVDDDPNDGNPNPDPDMVLSPAWDVNKDGTVDAGDAVLIAMNSQLVEPYEKWDCSS